MNDSKATLDPTDLVASADIYAAAAEFVGDSNRCRLRDGMSFGDQCAYTEDAFVKGAWWMRATLHAKIEAELKAESFVCRECKTKYKPDDMAFCPQHGLCKQNCCIHARCDHKGIGLPGCTTCDPRTYR